jgi:protein phosphatase
MKIQHWLGTDVGLVRDSNDDAFLWLGPNETNGRGWLWLVADGMGGSGGGDIASSILVRTAEELWPGLIGSARDPWEALDRLLHAANDRILKHAADTGTNEMGTTAACLAIVDGHAYVAHVGDSRVYVLRNLSLKRLTVDHSVEEAGGLQRKGLADGPAASALLRVLGRPGLEVDFGDRTPITISDEVFMLCTDGAWSVLENRFVEGALQRLNAKDAVESLAELARLNWSDDNLTLGVVRCAPPAPVMATDRAGFLAWIAGTAPIVGQQRTVVFSSANVAPDHGAPPRTNIPLPTVPEPVVALDSGSTTMFSPQQMAEFRAALAASGADGGAGSAAPAAPAPAGDVGSTTMFSPQQVEEFKKALSNAPQVGPPVNQAAGPPKVDSGSTQIMPSASASSPALPVGGNASTMAFSQENADELRRLAGIATEPPPDFKRRERTAALSRDEIERLRDAVENVEPARRSKWPIALAALVLVGVGAAAAYVLFIAPPSEGSAEVNQEVAATLVDAPEQPAPPLLPPRSPRAADGVHADDEMPYFLVNITGAEGPETLLVDAYEVQTRQMTRIRRAIADVDLVYRTASAPLFEFMPCSGLAVDDDDASSSRPVCASPESAEIYCNALGRQLPSVEQWQAILGASPELVAPTRGKLWGSRADGRPPEWTGEINGIYGVHDGLPEILRVDRATAERGDMPLLKPASDGSPMVMLPGVLRSLRARTLAQNDIPMLGFRCVAVAAPAEEAAVEGSSGEAMVGAAVVEGTPAAANVQDPAGEPSTPAEPGTRAAPAEPPAAAGAEAENTPAEAAPSRPSGPSRPSALPSTPAARPPAARQPADPPSGSRVPTTETDEPAAAPLQTQAERERARRQREAAAPEGVPEARPTTSTGRVRLMDPVYLPPTIEEYERQVEERIGEQE